MTRQTKQYISLLRKELAVDKTIDHKKKSIQMKLARRAQRNFERKILAINELPETDALSIVSY